MKDIERIKVLHCVGSLKSGGAEKQLKLIVDNLDKNRYKSIILCLFSNELDKNQNKDIDIIDLGYRYKIDIVRILPRIYRVIREVNPDIVHIWLPELITVPSAVIAYILKIPIISTHRHSPEIRVSGVQWIRDRLRYIGHMLSSRIVVNFDSKCLDNHFLKHIFKFKDGIVIPNAINVNSIQKMSSDRCNFYIKQARFNIVFSGRLIEQKQPMVALQAFKMLLNEKVPCHLHIFGVGPDLPLLQKEVEENNFSDVVTFYGYQDKWLSLAAKADAFILPTKGEGMSNVLLEAACVGLPIVTSDLPENRMIFTNGLNAILVEDLSANGFFKALKTIHSDRDLLDKIRDNARILPDKFSVNRMISSYDKLYSSVL